MLTITPDSGYSWDIAASLYSTHIASATAEQAYPLSEGLLYSKSSRSKDLSTAFCQHPKRLSIVAGSACECAMQESEQPPPPDCCMRMQAS